MTGVGRPCQRQRKMMGRGAEGGCGTEEKPCPVSRVPVGGPPATEGTPAPAPSPAVVNKSISSGIDLYSQATKALSERCVFDSEEVLASTIPTLPSGLGSLLAKHSDSRKRHKKAHSDSKSSKKGSLERPKGCDLWVKSEEYFRELNLLDVERLHQLSTMFELLASCSYFSIPVVGSACINMVENGEVCDARVKEVEEEIHAKEPSLAGEDVSSKEEPQLMEIDTGDNGGLPSAAVESSPPCHSQSLSSVEWVLGSRNKILLSTERPTKKRKLLGENAGLQRLLVAQPCVGTSRICDFCSVGDTGDQLNQLAVCSSCNVAVHQKCYGIQGNVNESWMCFWCKRNTGALSGQDVSNNKPCVLCPKPGGALKPIRTAGSGNEGSVEFAHLFCCQWMPEVYVNDMRMMEPILNVDGIKETRRKLICNVCKVRHGTCVRCTEGSCRTSFHPICAREAGQRLEVWGKLGCDDVELRAFCSKHSDISNDHRDDQRESSVIFAHDSLASEHPGLSMSDKTLNEHNITSNNNEKAATLTDQNNVRSNIHSDVERHDVDDKEAVSSERREIVCDKSALSDTDTLDRTRSELASAPDSLDLSLVLKKLIDRGKISLKDLAAEIGISPDSLAAMLADDHLFTEMRFKIIKWLGDHAFMASSQKDLSVKTAFTPKADRHCDDSTDVRVKEPDLSDVVPVKSVPPRRRTTSNIRIVKDHNIMVTFQDSGRDNGILDGDVEVQQSTNDDSHIGRSKASDHDSLRLIEDSGFPDSQSRPLSTSRSNPLGLSNCSNNEIAELETTTTSRICTSTDVSQENPALPVVHPASHSGKNLGLEFGFYIHPYILEKIKESEFDVTKSLKEWDGPMEQKSISSVCMLEKQCDFSLSCVASGNGHGVTLEDIGEAMKKGILDLNPEDEVEGEIVYFQHKILGIAALKRKLSDDLICKIVRKLPQELETIRKQRWDSVLVNQYLHELREAKKQGRKEKRHKEAQAVLAAAAAAAAASSRTSSLRKDGVDDSSYLQNPLKLDSQRGRSGQLPSTPHVKEAASSLVVPKNLLDAQSDLLQLTPSDLKENSRLCDICGRPETILNAILVCSCCKVAVHLDCYRSVRETTGPWICELCEDMSSSKCSSISEASSANDPHPWVECGLCGVANKSAFRKTSDGQWVHAFCAEWVFGSTFKRGQVNHVGGMESVIKVVDICSICNRRFGVCIKCNIGDCQSTFHPSCARSAGYYLSVRRVGGNLQHKAYCSKHSFEQAKLDNQKHGIEELNSLKQMRVELEKLRLICDRIVRRERLKRDLVLCSHDLVASKRDSMTYSSLIQSSSFLPEISSESATTSLRGHTDGSKSCSDVMQKSDDVTVDSTVSHKRRIKLPPSNDNDQKTDDSSTSRSVPTPRSTDRVSFGGKHVPFRASIAHRNIHETGGKKLKSRKHTETFEKELIMTSDQATMKNQRLPKGYIYVPIDRLCNEKQEGQDAPPGQGDQDDG